MSAVLSDFLEALWENPLPRSFLLLVDFSSLWLRYWVSYFLAGWQAGMALSSFCAQKTVHIPCHLAPFIFKPEMVIHTSPASQYWLLLLQSSRESSLLLKSSWLVQAHPDNLPILLINRHVTLPHHRVKSIKFMQGGFTGGQESLRITLEFFPPCHGTLLQWTPGETTVFPRKHSLIFPGMLDCYVGRP